MRKNKIVIRAAAFFMTLILVIGVAVLNNQRVAQAVESETPAAENDFLLCHDGVDNDGDIALDSSDSDCAQYFVVETSVATSTDSENTETETSTSTASSTTSVAMENDFLLCHDGVDNDDDITIDASDSDCTFYWATSTATSTDEGNGTTTATTTSPTAENTLAMCTDGIDNDSDIVIDLSDSDCAPFASTILATSTATSTDTGNGGTGSGSGSTGTGSGGSGGFSSFSGGSSSGSGLPTGQGVLGASTGPTDGSVCVPTLLGFLRMNQVNNPTEVKKLQVILNTFLGTKLPINGIFGIDTQNAVNQLQSAQSELILMPWVRAGLMTYPVPTGYVFKTTSWYINNRLCGGNALPMPMLP